jgi:hypothetical protein
VPLDVCGDFASLDIETKEIGRTEVFGGGALANSVGFRVGKHEAFQNGASRLDINLSGLADAGNDYGARPDKTVLTLESDGGVIIDPEGLNIGYGPTPGLMFGESYSGQGIASDRSPDGFNPLGLDFFTGGERRMSIANNGNVGIGTNNPAVALEVNGTARVKVLQITGGADIAEPFDLSSKDVPQGAVLVIDREHPGHLKISRNAYDTCVAGIVSGANGINPGLTLHQQGLSDGCQVALSGRVYTLANASNGAIYPGDLLTTSDMPGYAMKASDRDRSPGAVIGKAMTSLEEGCGMVLVLVTLQ